MFPHELGDPSVRISFFFPFCYCISLLTSRRFAALLYTPEGEVLIQRVWDETMAELDFAGVRAILESMKVK